MREARELAQAARLIYQELNDTQYLIEHAVAQYEWWPHPSRSFSDRRWHDFGHILAALLDPEGWYLCTMAYEELRDVEAKLDSEYRASGSLPTFDRARDVEMRALWDSMQPARGMLAPLAGQVLSGGFDTVAAMEHAGTEAACDLMPGPEVLEGDALPPHRGRMEVRKTCEVTGIAVVGAPSWRQFDAALPEGLVLTVTVTDIRGSRACVVSTLGDRTATGDFAERFVPDVIRSDDGFEDFAFIIDRGQQERDFRVFPPND